MTAPLTLVQRYLSDGINGRDRGVLAEVLAPDYRFETGGYVVSGLDDYLAMVDGYFAREPTVRITVHDVFTDGKHVAVYATKHTTAPRAAWDAVLIYAGDSQKLTRCWSEQDWTAYYRHRAGEPVPEVVPPDHDPWAVPAIAADEAVDHVALEWVRAGGYGAFLSDPEISLNCGFSAGRRFAFHATERGTHAPAAFHLAGMGIVNRGRVADVRLIHRGEQHDDWILRARASDHRRLHQLTVRTRPPAGHPTGGR